MPKSNPLKRKPAKESRFQKQKQRQSVSQNVTVNLTQPKIRYRKRTTNLREKLKEKGNTTITNVYQTSPVSQAPTGRYPSSAELSALIRSEYAEGARRAALEAQRKTNMATESRLEASATYAADEPAPRIVGGQSVVEPTPEPVPEPTPEPEPVSPFEAERPQLLPDVEVAPENPLKPPKPPRAPYGSVKAARDKANEEKKLQMAEALASSAESQFETPERVPKSPPSTSRMPSASLFEQIRGGRAGLKAVSLISTSTASTASINPMLEQIRGGRSGLKTPSVTSSSSTVPLFEQIRAGKAGLKPVKPKSDVTSMYSGFEAVTRLNPMFRLRQNQQEEEDNKRSAFE